MAALKGNQKNVFGGKQRDGVQKGILGISATTTVCVERKLNSSLAPRPQIQNDGSSSNGKTPTSRGPLKNRSDIASKE